MPILTKHYRPVTWLQQLIDLKPAHFLMGKAIRSGLSICLTFALGLLSGHPLEGVFVSIAALCFSAGEGSSMTYRAMFRHTLIATFIGGLGAFTGLFLGFPWFVTIIIMTLFSFLGAILSNYGTPYSVGSMIALVMASIVIGMPLEGMGWKLYICFQIGTAFYLLLLGCEALIDSHYPERQLLSKHIKALANFARIKSLETLDTQSDKTKTQKSLDQALDSYFTLYSALLSSKYHNSPERSQEADRQAAFLQTLDSALSHLTAVNDAVLLSNAMTWLDEIADAIDHKHKTPPEFPAFFTKTSGLFYSIARLSENLWPSSPAASDSLLTQQQTNIKIATKEKIQMALKRLIVGKEALTQALVFAACMGTAFAAKYVVTGNHWFWVPLSVALTMKPDFGSVFARAITRCLGTVLGALIGTLLLLLLPKGMLLILSIGVLAMLLPWTTMISYATKVTSITAILLVLLDLLNTAPVTINYAGQRIGDTILASMIILVFSYLVWPRSKHEELSKKFNDVIDAVKNYLKSACQDDAHDAKNFEKTTKDVFKAKVTAYRNISDLRTLLHRLMVEPAPIGTEATSWFPLVAGAERLCDKITIYFIHRTADSKVPNTEDIHYLLNQLDILLEQKSSEVPHAFSEQDTDVIKAFLFDVNEEINNLSKLLGNSIPVDKP